MDWTAFTLVIPIFRWIKKRLDIAALERRVLERERNVEKREIELGALIKTRDENIKHLPDLVFLEPSSLHYILGQIKHVCEIQFTITNRSIFDITLTKFTAKPEFQGHVLAEISDVNDREIKKQSAISFMITYNLQEVTTRLIEELTQQRSRMVWRFEMHGYFRSDFGTFERSQGDSVVASN